MLFQKTQRLPSASLGSDVKQIDDLKPGEQPMVSKKPNAAWHTDWDGRGWKGMGMEGGRGWKGEGDGRG